MTEPADIKQLALQFAALELQQGVLVYRVRAHTVRAHKRKGYTAVRVNLPPE